MFMGGNNHPWVIEHAGCKPCVDSKNVVLLLKGKIVAGVQFDSWTETTAQVHVAIKNPMALRHHFLEEVFTYFFVTCGKLRLLGLTPADNAKALRFNKRIGLRETYRIKDGHAEGVDLVLQEMTRDECRWIEHGWKEQSKRSAA